MKIIVIDDVELLGLDLIKRLKEFYDENIIFHNNVSEFDVESFDENDLIFIDFYREGQLSTTDFLSQNPDILKQTIVHSSHYEEYVFEELKLYPIKAFIPRDLSSLFLKQLIHYDLFTEDSYPTINQDNNLDFLVVKKKNFYLKLQLDDIKYIEVDNKYVIFHTITEKFLHRDSLRSIISRYPGKFARIHAKYAINIEYFIKFDYREQIVYLEEDSLPLSRHFRPQFYNYLKSYSLTS